MKIQPRWAQAVGIVIVLIVAGYGLTPGDGRYDNNDALQTAFEQRLSDHAVQGEATILRVLPDDNQGSRHQRLIVALDSGQTVLIAHNIDLAPRIDEVREGDQIEFSGVYEWNDKGGVVHWTHHDPQGRREGGWLRHDGRIYR